jgi:hypothetical protein
MISWLKGGARFMKSVINAKELGESLPDFLFLS